MAPGRARFETCVGQAVWGICPPPSAPGARSGIRPGRTFVPLFPPVHKKEGGSTWHTDGSLHSTAIHVQRSPAARGCKAHAAAVHQSPVGKGEPLGNADCGMVWPGFPAGCSAQHLQVSGQGKASRGLGKDLARYPPDCASQAWHPSARHGALGWQRPLTLPHPHPPPTADR